MDEARDEGTNITSFRTCLQTWIYREYWICMRPFNLVHIKGNAGLTLKGETCTILLAIILAF